MPHIIVYMRQGRTVEQKREFAKALTDATVRTLSVKPEAVSVILNEIPDQNLAREGVLFSDKH